MVRQVTAAHMDLTSSDEDLDDTVEVSNSSQLEAVQHLQQPLDGLHLYVCCHGSRDTRCGKFGNSLVRKLDNLIQQQQLQETVQVFKCSHVGGHKVQCLSNSCAACMICSLRVIEYLCSSHDLQ